MEHWIYSVICPILKCNNCSQKRHTPQQTKPKNIPPGGSSGDMPGREGEKNTMFNIPPTNRPSHWTRINRPPGTAPSTTDTAGRL